MMLMNDIETIVTPKFPNNMKITLNLNEIPSKPHACFALIDLFTFVFTQDNSASIKVLKHLFA